MTLYAMANVCLEAVLNVLEQGSSVEELAMVLNTHRILRQVDAIILPADLVDHLISRLMFFEKQPTLEQFRQLGFTLANLLRIRSPKLTELSDVATDFLVMVPLKRIEIKEAEGGVEVNVVGAGRRMESTECTLSLLEGLLAGYGYRVLEKNVTVGVIRLKAIEPAQIE
ncbi:MAG: hypothetical protein HYU39_02825 [Thaumarchaeota archaeon]|nr:hypothetical protein [Nitrososphaerota archaeon]